MRPLCNIIRALIPWLIYYPQYLLRSVHSTSTHATPTKFGQINKHAVDIIANINSLNYLLTPRCKVLLEKLTGLQLVKKFPAFHGTRRFITALRSVRHLSLSRASPIQSIYPHLTSWRSILILSTHLCLGLPSGLFPSRFPTKNLRKLFLHRKGHEKVARVRSIS